MEATEITRRLWLKAGRASIPARAKGAPEIDAEVVALAQGRYVTLSSKVPWPPKAMLRFHLTVSVLPQVALYTSMRTLGWDKEPALAAAAKSVGSTVPAVRRVLSALTKSKHGRDIFMWVAQRSMAAFPSPGWECQWIERSPQRVAFNMTRCYDLGVLRQLGVGELAPLFCAADDLLYDGLCPHLVWQRTGTLARGDDVCDFSFERTDVSESFWSRIAGTYEADHRHIAGSDLVEAMQSQVAEAVPAGDVVEFACGTGMFTRAYAPRCRSVIATDISVPMLKEAERELSALPNVSLRAADATATGLPGQSADAVVVVNLLHIVPDPAAILTEAHRLLRPGGVLVAADVASQAMSMRQMVSSAWRVIRRWGLGSRGGKDLNQKSLEELVRAAGFETLEGRLLTGQWMNAVYVRAVKAR